MSQIRFTASDVADIRFSISPLWETVRSVYALADPGRYAIHVPWIRQVYDFAGEPALTRQLSVLRRFARPGGWLPDFLTPPPVGPLMEFDNEVTKLAATPPDVVAADLAATSHRQASTAPRVEDPPRVLAELVTAACAWHAVAIRPFWPRIRGLLEGDIAYRARQLAEGGARRLFDTLHPSMRWAGDRLICDDPWHIDRDLQGRGLPLIPSVFVDRRVLWAVRAESAPIGVYPARAIATLWERQPLAPHGLAAAFGSTRARLLCLLDAPATTTELARRVELSAPTVSEHLHALNAAGLVTRARTGRTVLYSLSAAGASLLHSHAADGHLRADTVGSPPTA